MGKAIVRLVGLLMCGIVFGQSYRPVEVLPSVSGSYRYLTPEDLWQVVLKGGVVQRPLLLRLEVYLYDEASGQLLYRGSSFALSQPEPVWEVDFGVLSGFGAIRQEGVSVQWWSAVQQNGGYLLSGRYRAEYVVVETDEKCVWTGIELARGETKFEVVLDYVIEPVFPLNGDTICGTPQFIWEIVGIGKPPYTLDIYYGRVGFGEVSGVRPLATFSQLSQTQLSGMGTVIMNQAGWYTYVVRGSDGVISKPVWFYFQPACSEEENQTAGRVVPSGWWHQLDYTEDVQAIRSHGDTVYLEWLQSCPEQALFRVGGKEGLTVLTYTVSGPWHRAIALVPNKEEELSVEIKLCGKTYHQNWKIVR